VMDDASMQSPQQLVASQAQAVDGPAPCVAPCGHRDEKGITIPSRTAASRRQRRKQHVAVVPGSHEANTVGKVEPDHNTRESPSSGPTLWPATPESTPPSTPRAPNLGPGWPFVLQAPEATVTEFGASQTDGDECDQLLLALSDGPSGDIAAQRQAVMELVIMQTWQLASTQNGCRVVQRALEVGEASERVALSQQLRGHVWEACISPHANHVLQMCIELIPDDCIQFVLDELHGSIVSAARHRYGCRVLERLIEHCSVEQTAGLVDELLDGAAQLCRHTFGNFVVQHVLMHGLEDQRQQIVAILRGDIQRLARHRVASHVVRCALVHCSTEDRQQLALAMAADAREFADLAHHHCGSFVVREMKRLDGSKDSS